jgi:hypothetical protein
LPRPESSGRMAPNQPGKPIGKSPQAIRALPARVGTFSNRTPHPARPLATKEAASQIDCK